MSWMIPTQFILALTLEYRAVAIPAQSQPEIGPFLTIHDPKRRYVTTSRGQIIIKCQSCTHEEPSRNQRFARERYFGVATLSQWEVTWETIRFISVGLFGGERFIHTEFAHAATLMCACACIRTYTYTQVCVLVCIEILFIILFYICIFIHILTYFLKHACCSS